MFPLSELPNKGFPNKDTPALCFKESHLFLWPFQMSQTPTPEVANFGSLSEPRPLLPFFLGFSVESTPIKSVAPFFSHGHWAQGGCVNQASARTGTSISARLCFLRRSTASGRRDMSCQHGARQKVPATQESLEWALTRKGRKRQGAFFPCPLPSMCQEIWLLGVAEHGPVGIQIWVAIQGTAIHVHDQRSLTMTHVPK